jgi:putative two-component system response regulator
MLVTLVVRQTLTVDGFGSRVDGGPLSDSRRHTRCLEVLTLEGAFVRKRRVQTLLPGMESIEMGNDLRLGLSGSAASAGTILVVDDLEANVRLLERLLRRDGHRVLIARDGAEAIAQVERHPPDVILMDVVMPTLDGFETCRRLKENPSTRLVPIVLLTAMQESGGRVRGLEAGADDFLRKPVDPAELSARVQSLVRLKRYTDDLDTAESVILSLGLTIEARDATTDGHCQRLARYAVDLGREAGLAEDELAALAKGGFLHDIGKVGIPDAILLKPAPLTAAEFGVMKRHTEIGDRLCGQLRSLRRVRPIVRHHHELLDGSGYPDGLRGGAVPLLAQIMGVVDVFDALISSRPYKAPIAVERAFDQLTAEAVGGRRDRDLVKAFERIAARLQVTQPPRHLG